MTKPIVRRLSDLTSHERVARSFYRTELSRIETSADLTQCRQPVWVSCFFDGTGNNYRQDGFGKTGLDSVKYSNIAKLGKFAHVEKDQPNRTYGIYAPGVGTPFPEVGDSGTGIDKANGMAAAGKGQARIDWVLNELKVRVDSHMPHVNQINVAVFGFSRGAAQARAFVRRLSEMCGRMGEDLLWTQSGGIKLPRLVIYFMGIFDTVASVGFGGSRFEDRVKTSYAPVTAVLLGGPLFGPALGVVAGGVLYTADHGGHAEWADDLRIPSDVRFCEHFVAAHEVREKFPSESVREDQVVPANCRETSYPGCHSDVGGGYAAEVQEGRGNELANIALCNMYLSAYAAGVPFKSPDEVNKAAGALFDISDELKQCFEAYMSVVADAPRLEGQVISHMNNYYHWRCARTAKKNRERKEVAAIVARGQQVMTAIPDEYMSITDKEWEAAVQDIAEKRTGFFRSNTYPHEDAIFEAWKGTLRKSLSEAKRALFDKFFDRYVHDSIAGFKDQMKAGGVGIAEESHWARNRQFFMGKRDKKFLYWRYEGKLPETSGTKTAIHLPPKSSGTEETALG